MTDDDLAAARRSYILCSLDELTREERSLTRGSAAHVVVCAAVDQCRGDVEPAATRLLALVRRDARARGIVADILVPLLNSLQRGAEAEELLGDESPNDAPSRSGLFAVMHAVHGLGERSRASAERARSAREADALERMLVEQRTALAAYHRGDHFEAIERARAARALAQRLGGDRAAAAALSVEYAAVHAGTADASRAWHLATALTEAARRGGDRSRRALGEVALYELAVERGDLATAEALSRSFDREPLPQQYRERFTHVIADVCSHLLREERYAAADAQLIAIESTTDDPAERALCRALRALCTAALGETVIASKSARQAIALTKNVSRSLAPGAMRQRRIARALGIAVGLLAHDVARGTRALDVAFLRHDPDVAAIVAAARGEVRGEMSTVDGYAAIVRSVRTRILADASTPLTATERDVLALLAGGMSTHDVSVARGCSVHTTRSHVRNAAAKLHARGRVDAIGRATKMGLISA
jgi:DNA-binding CsgD family transcriptional regulator